MRRRGFLGSIFAAIAAPFIGRAKADVLASPAWRLEDDAFILNGARFARAEPCYVAFMHPGSFVDVIEAFGRQDQRWNIAWRRYRVARKAGECEEMEPRQIMERFLEPRRPFPITGEIGSYESVRFIESERIPA